MECKLCGKDRELENSHIIPKFIYKWIKKTSVTGGLRHSQNPNERKQDGDSLPFLCGKCEDKFQKFEEHFQKDFFSKATMNQLGKMEVTERCRDFCLSLIWRALKFRVEKNMQLHELDEKEMSLLNEFLSHCENYFNESITDELIKYSIHIIPTTEEMEDKERIPNLTTENQRGTDHSYRAFSEEKEGYNYLLYYVKIPFFLIVAEIVKNEKYVWENTELIVGNEIFYTDEMIFPQIVNEIIRSIHENKENSKKMMTLKQQEKLKASVKKEFKNNPDKFNKSGSIKAMLRNKNKI